MIETERMIYYYYEDVWKMRDEKKPIKKYKKRRKKRVPFLQTRKLMINNNIGVCNLRHVLR